MQNNLDLRVDSTVKIATKHATRSLHIPLILTIAIIGCLCTMIVCTSMIPVVFHETRFWGITISVILLTCLLSLLPKHLHLLGWLPLLGGAVRLVILDKEMLILGAKHFYNAYYCAAHRTETLFFELDADAALLESAVTSLMCCTAAMLCGLTVRLLVRKPKFIPYFLLTFIPVELGLYQGLKMNLLAMLILIVTWFGVLAMQLASYRMQQQKNGVVRRGNAANCGIAAIALTTASVMIGVFAANQLHLIDETETLEKRREVRHQIEDIRWEDIKGGLSKIGILLGLLEDPDLRKLGSKDSLHRHDEDDVRLTLTEIFDGSLYLKNYTGSVYEENQWKSLPEEVWEQQNALPELFEQFECVPQILPFMSNQSIYGNDDATLIEIEPLVHMDSTLQPYASYSEGVAYRNDNDCIADNTESYKFALSKSQDFRRITSMPLGDYFLPTDGFNFDDEVTTTFFDLLNADISQGSLRITSKQAPYLDDSIYKTPALQTALVESYIYRDFVHETYANAPTNTALQEVYEALPEWLLDTAQNCTTEEILYAIRQYLAEQTKYTLSPGKTPSTRDFTAYFLLENRQGYCMHYATAGTILARYFGIPARYCEGYAVSQEEAAKGKHNADGTITIVIPNEMSHAWCEYYIDGYGWIPFEMTPGYYSTEAVESPTASVVGTDVSNTLETEPPVTETTIETVTESSTQTTVMTTLIDEHQEDIPGSHANASHGGLSGTGFLKMILRIAVIILILLIATLTLILLRKIALNKRRHAFYDADTIAAMQQVYHYLMQLLHLLGLNAENRQTLIFAQEVRTSLDADGYDGSGAEKIISLALAADMGGKAPTKEQVHISVRCVTTLAEQIAAKKSIPARLIMMYIRRLR